MEAMSISPPRSGGGDEILPLAARVNRLPQFHLCHRFRGNEALLRTILWTRAQGSQEDWTYGEREPESVARIFPELGLHRVLFERARVVAHHGLLLPRGVALVRRVLGGRL